MSRFSEVNPLTHPHPAVSLFAMDLKRSVGWLKRFFRRNWRSIFILVALIIDVLIILSNGITAYVIRNSIFHASYIPPEVFIRYGSFFTVALILFGLLLGLYRGAYRSNIRQQYKIAGRAYLYSIFAVFTSFYILQLRDLPPRFTLLFFFLLPIFFIIGRALLNRFNLAMQRRGFGVRNVLILGYDRKGIELFERFHGFPELGYNVKGIAMTKGETRTPSNGVRTIRYEHPSDLVTFLREEHIDRIFIPSVKLVTNGEAALVEVCRKNSVKLKLLSPESDNLLRIARIHDIAGITLASPERRKVERLRKAVKRLFDVIGATILIALLSPVFVAAGVAIYIESGRPIIFKHLRAATKNGKRFYFFKFRSMVKDADEAKVDLYRFNDSDGALFKLKNDPRLTRVGKTLRRFSVDELPQLFNVLKGDMSLVGPRPLPVADFDLLKESPEFWEAIRDREKVKPGMTGLWQISGRSNIGFKEMVLLDLYYIENQSLLFDVEILFATIPAVVFGKGAY